MYSRVLLSSARHFSHKNAPSSRCLGRYVCRRSQQIRHNVSLLSSQVRLFSVCNPRQNRFTATNLVGPDGIVGTPWDPVDIPDVPLADYLFGDFEKYGESTALIDGLSGSKLSYNELLNNVTKVASGLTRLGLVKGDVITIYAPNSIEWAVMYLAVLATGATASAVNPLYTAGELIHAVSHSRSKFVVTIKELAGIAKEAVAQCPLVKEIIIFNECEGCRPLSTLLADDGLAYPKDVAINPKDDVIALPYSSGTTGLPKGVMLTHNSIIANLQQMCIKELAEHTPDDTLLAVLPFFHIYGQIVILLSGLRQGAKIVTLPKFDPALYLNLISQHRCNFLHVVPPISLLLAKHPMVAKADLSSVTSVVVAAAPCSPEVIEGASVRLNNKVLFRQGYGMTEASPVTHLNANDHSLNRFKTSGPSLPNTDFKIVDIETGDILGEGKEGEICIRGPQIMKGYFENPEATSRTIIDGFLHSGDIGYYDNMGHVIITDRLKELIKFKGFQVAPAELEALLLTHPAIQDAAVIGKPDEKAGELPRAYVVKAPNQNISAEEVQNLVKEKLAAFKQLSGGVVFVDEIPKSASGKILRRVLRDELVNND